ncbi:hypothetical protein AC1031_010917 [Aphanomyces cochlioides]|nr:hypothetical protein AC1031_010917 [Aphanomyces cochlioides]
MRALVKKQAEAETDQTAEAGDDVLAMRVVKRTREQYESALARFAKWLQVEHPSLVQDGRIQLPLDVSACQGILNYISVKRSRNGEEMVPTQQNSFATVSAMENAIKYLYKERGCKLAAEINEMFANYSAGYQRKIAGMKLKGELKINEGKSPMSIAGKMEKSCL